jgi:hypothetical protein
MGENQFPQWYISVKETRQKNLQIEQNQLYQTTYQPKYNSPGFIRPGL